MISEKHFHYEVGYDDEGITVTVTHKPTRRQLSDRPSQGERIPAVQARLARAISAGIMDEKDFNYRVGRCSVDGRFADWYEVEHIPTKRKKSLDTINSPQVKSAHVELLDSLVEELWRDGILPKRNEDAESGDCSK